MEFTNRKIDNFNRKTDIVMGVGIKIKRLREERKISQPELADLLGISQSTLSNIESESSQKIDFHLMEKFARYLTKISAIL